MTRQNMEITTTLTEALERTDKKEMYDKACKEVLANKQILAHIMKECMSEYHNISVKDIAELYIEGEPNIGNINVKTGENIIGMSTEDLSSPHGATFYDLRYRALVPYKEKFVELLVNVEAQNKYNPGYSLVKRGINYGARMITSQYGTEFTKSDYQKTKKVYSVWICRNVPKRLRNTITSYEISENSIVGDAREKKANYDLLTVVMVYLGDSDSKSESNVLNLLNKLLAENIGAQEKIEFLADEFAIARSQKLEGDVSLMCNLSEGIFEKGIEKGIEQERVNSIAEKLEIAKNLLSMNSSVDDVAKATGLSIAEVELLK